MVDDLRRGDHDLDKELEHIYRRLLEEGNKVIAFFESLSIEQLEMRVYTEGTQWNVRQILCHLISAEKAYLGLLENLTRKKKPLLFDQDIDVFNESEVQSMDGIPVPELIEGFRWAREKTLHLVEDLHAEDLSQTAVHPWFGEREIGWLLKLIYRHNTMHLQDVRRLVQNGTSPSRSADHV